MKCWPGWASSASTTTWYIVTARASATATAIGAQRAGDLVQQRERLAEAPGQLGLDGLQRRRAIDAVAAPDDLVHEALEEDRVARLVDLLGAQEVLLLLARGGVDERREVVGDRVLAVEEHRVLPQRGAALVLRHHLVPLAAVLGEVDLGRAPVAALPARVEIRRRRPAARRRT